MTHSRRNLLKLGVGAAAALAISPSLFAAGKKLPVGLQLYSVRNECAKDLPAVLEAVAKMGFDGVEFAGYHNRKADEMRKLLDANKLKCCGTHTALDTLNDKNLAATIEYNKTIGNKYLVVPYLDYKKFLSTAELCKSTAKLLTDIAAKVKDQGMRVGYHAHGSDFGKIGDSTAWDMLFENAGPDVIMQLDTCNCLGGKGDPVAILKKFPGKSVTVHLKEFGGKPGAVIGEGVVKWNEVFEICETTGGTEWYIIEHESDPKTPIQSVEKCLQAYRKMGK